MIGAVGDRGTSMIHDLAAAIIHDGKVPGRVSLSVSTRVRGCRGQGQLPWSQVDRAGHKSSGDDYG